VGGDGRVAIKGVPPSVPQSQFRKRIAIERVNALFEVCIHFDLVTIQFPARDAFVPDETHTTLMLMNGIGEIRKVMGWGNDPQNEGFEQLCNALKMLT